MIFACVFSNNILSTVKSVIHFECNVQLVARMIQPRYAIHRFPRNVHLDARKIQPRYAIHRFPRSVQLVARMIHKGNETKCGDFCVSFFKQRIANRQECYSFRATSCTLRFPVSCIKMHATIQDFVQQVARYDSGVDTNRGDVSDVARTL